MLPIPQIRQGNQIDIAIYGWGVQGLSAPPPPDGMGPRDCRPRPPPDGMGPILQGSWTAGLAAARLVSRFVSRKQLRSSHNGFEAVWRIHVKNSTHAIRHANTMVFTTFSNHQIISSKEYHLKCKVNKPHPPHRGGGLSHPHTHPTGGGASTITCGGPPPYPSGGGRPWNPQPYIYEYIYIYI